MSDEAAATIRDLQARLEQAERERDAAIHLVQRYDVVAHKIEAERDEARALLREAGEVVKPFSQTAGELFARNYEDHEVVVRLVSEDGFDIPMLTFLDFRRARAFLDKLENTDG